MQRGFLKITKNYQCRGPHRGEPKLLKITNALDQEENCRIGKIFLDQDYIVEGPAASGAASAEVQAAVIEGLQPIGGPGLG
jgi:hypothetical protein